VGRSSPAQVSPSLPRILRFAQNDRGQARPSFDKLKMSGASSARYFVDIFAPTIPCHLVLDPANDRKIAQGK